MGSAKVRKLVISGILSALVFIVTSFTMVRMPFVIIKEAYFHAGDSIIFLSGLVLGAPTAAVVSGLGSFFADLYLGAPQYMFGTLVIKGIMGAIAGCFLFKRKGEPSFQRMILGLGIAGFWMAFGYYLYEVLFLSINPIANLPMLLANLAQAVIGIVIFLPLSRSAARLKKNWLDR